MHAWNQSWHGSTEEFDNRVRGGRSGDILNSAVFMSQSSVNTVTTSLDAVVEAYKKDIDRTLLRENLKLTVTERFQRAMAHAKFADELRRAGRKVAR
jgi:hypothetical protein